MKMTWASGRDGSIEIEYEKIELSFKDIDEMDSFLEALTDTRNEISEFIEESQKEADSSLKD